MVVAFVVQQQVEVAVTYNPVRRELLHAGRGQGAFCNDQPIHVSATSHLPGALVLASRSETGRGEWERFRDMLTVRPMGSIAYKLAQVAQGKCDMTFSLVPKNEWDICAGTLLVTEAGGQVTDLQGQPFRFNQPETLRAGLIATNGHLHAPGVAPHPGTCGLISVVLAGIRRRWTCPYNGPNGQATERQWRMDLESR